ncbi:MAG: 23S rRNA (pseudouridine(1915)-N(3))-methyltransferase RlmH, partial [Bacteroidota bacterium]
LLFDENGKSYSSLQLAKAMEKWLQLSNRKLIFLIGGAYGFPDKIYRRAQTKISLSGLTFSHQMVRLFAMEQLYRSMTILKGEPYHHQ